jgi:hypothetical protein
MSFGRLGGMGRGFGHLGAPLGSANASQYGDGPAPPGFHWDFVTDDLTGARVSDDVTGQPVVDLVGN